MANCMSNIKFHLNMFHQGKNLCNHSHIIIDFHYKKYKKFQNSNMFYNQCIYDRYLQFQQILVDRYSHINYCQLYIIHFDISCIEQVHSSIQRNLDHKLRTKRSLGYKSNQFHMHLRIFNFKDCILN